jgi:hypothetical protein
VTPDVVDSFPLDPDSFSLNSASAINPAEALFLNILCKGLPRKWKCAPSLSTTAGNPDSKRIHELWNLATGFCCDWAGLPFPEQEVADATQFLLPHLSNEQIDRALGVMKQYSQEILVEKDTAARCPTGIRPKYVLDTDDFKAQAIDLGFMGSVGAIAYALSRNDLGAFQRPKSNQQDEASKKFAPAL